MKMNSNPKSVFSSEEEGAKGTPSQMSTQLLIQNQMKNTRMKEVSKTIAPKKHSLTNQSKNNTISKNQPAMLQGNFFEGQPVDMKQQILSINGKAIQNSGDTFEILDQEFLKNMPNLSRQSSIPSQPDSNFQSNSFLDNENKFPDLQVFGGQTDQIDWLNHTQDLLQALNQQNVQKHSFSHQNKMSEQSYSQQKANLSNNAIRPNPRPNLENSFSSSGSNRTKKSLSGVTYDTKRASFNIDNLDTIKSGYTFRTEVIDNTNDRESQDGRESDHTILSNYTASQQISHQIIDPNLSRESAAEQYTGTLQKLSYLGGGSEAKVYLIKHPENAQLYALKLYDSSRVGEDSYETVKSEFEIVRSAAHENVIEYYSLYKPKASEDRSCVEFGIIMEYMRGGTLEKFIEQNFVEITMKQKKSYIRQILKGLEYLHQFGILYRDLKVKYLFRL